MTEGKKFQRKYLIAGIVLVIIIVAAVASYLLLIQRPSGVQEVKIGILCSFSGTMADVGKTQRDGAILAIEEINAAGGLNMPWGKVKVSYVSRDDETNVDVATRRFWELVESEKVVAVIGTCWAPILVSLNTQVKNAKVIYGHGSAWFLNVINASTRSKYTIGPMPTGFQIAYTAAAYSIKQGWKRIYLLTRTDTWGWEARDGVKAAIEDLGGELVGYDEVPIGTPDFSSILLKVQQAQPDVFLFAQFAADQVNVLKQAYAMGLKSITKIFPIFVTNAVAAAVPAEALAETYGLHYFYWNLTGFKETEAIENAREYVENYMAYWGYPPDSYATGAYIVTKEILRLIQLTGSTDPDKIIEALETTGRSFMSPKGPGEWRIAHDAIFKYAFFVVQGKNPAARSGLYDLYNVIGYYGGEEIMPPLASIGYT